MNPTPRDDLQRAIQRVGRIFEEMHTDLEEARVHPGGDARELLERQRGSLGEEGVGFERALDAWSEWILPNAIRTPAPMYFGLLNTSPLPIASLVDCLVSALNQNAGAVHQGPSAWVAEQEVIRAFSQLVAPGDAPWRGMLLPGGTFANLQAILAARQRHFPEWDPGRGGAAARLYTTDSSHLSVARSGTVAGLGRANIVSVAGWGRGEMDVDALVSSIEADRAAGYRPFAVVATTGTTGTGAIDDLERIASVCEAHGLWFHVDACYGGAALLLDELRERFSGIERADSVALDPHKWFFLPLTSSLLLFRDPEVDQEAFDWSASYVPEDPADVSAWRRGIPMSRRASSLTVWTALRAMGWIAIREAVRRNVELARRLEVGLREAGLRVLPEGELSIVCARWEPPDVEGDDLDRLQTEIAAAACATGETWFATVRHAGETWLDFRMTNVHVRERHVDRLVEIVLREARRAVRPGTPSRG